MHLDRLPSWLPVVAADQQAPRKQPHTATQLFRRLRDEERYVGSYDQVRRYVAGRRGSKRDVSPLVVRAGQRAESDFGHFWVDFPEGRHQVPILLVTRAYSNATFMIALPSEKTEAILRGTVAAIQFFGCVPKELWWDNPGAKVHGVVGRLENLRGSRLWLRVLAADATPSFITTAIRMATCYPNRAQMAVAVLGRSSRRTDRQWVNVARLSPVISVNRIDGVRKVSRLAPCAECPNS